MNLSDYLYLKTYLRPGRFANIDWFMQNLGLRVDLTSSVDQPTARDVLCPLADSSEPGTRIGSDGEAEARLVSWDLKAMLSAPDEVDDALPTEDRMARCGPIIADRLASIGLAVDDVPIQIVDRFPKPFDKFDWSAFAPDREDEERFGVERGMYFRRDRLRPLYSEALCAHEMVHAITGMIDPEVYAMGLEEGLAEVVGFCYAALGFVPRDALTNILVYGRHGCNRAKLWSVYLDHTRQAYLLFEAFGLKGLGQLISRGRAAIHQAELAVLMGDLARLDLEAGIHDVETRDVLSFICAGYLPSHVFSPLECLLIQYVEAGRPLHEVCELADVDPKVGVPKLEALGAKSALFVQDGPKIGYSNAERYRAMEAASGIPLLRYLPSQPPT